MQSGLASRLRPTQGDPVRTLTLTRNNLNAIRDGLKKIADAEPQLTDQRHARAQLQTALRQPAATYESAVGTVDCAGS